MDNFHSKLKSEDGNAKYFGKAYLQKKSIKIVYLKNILGAFDFTCIT